MHDQIPEQGSDTKQVPPAQKQAKDKFSGKEPYQTKQGKLGPIQARRPNGKPLMPVPARHFGQLVNPTPDSVEPIQQKSEKEKKKPVQQKGKKEKKKLVQAKTSGDSIGSGLPTQLKENMEAMSGMDLSDVTVNYNSPKPKEMGALAYAQGNQIEIGPGQEKHLPHEAWHTVQQKQGRVQPNAQIQAKGLPLNNDPGLEKEADVMGEKANQGQASGNLSELLSTIEVRDDVIQQQATLPNVVIGNVNATTTPAGTPNRIPPRVNTQVNVTINNWHPPMNFVTFSIEGAGGGNGTATINGGATHQTSSSGILNLRGGTQTSPGNAGNLRLVAHLGSTRLAASNTFTVSSIGLNWTMGLDSIINTGSRWGMRVRDSWQSDSGNVADLDQLDISEQVQYSPGTGVFSGIPLNPTNSGYLPGNRFTTDDHTLGPVNTLKSLKGSGEIIAHQVSIQWDKRTGTKNMSFANSGYEISKRIAYNSGTTTLTTNKTGANTTANTYSSNAGQGTATDGGQVL